MPQQNVRSREEHETRERLLAEAEKVFAARGYEGASVRQITRAAGANVAAVSYYFGGKEGLYQAVFARLLEIMRERRIRRVEADMEAAGREITLEEFLTSFAEAFVEPLVEDERGSDFMSLFDQEMRLHRVPTAVLRKQLIVPIMLLFARSLERVGVELEPATAARCLMSMVGQLAHALKADRRLVETGVSEPLPVALEDMIPHIVRFSAAGIRRCAEADAETRRGGGSR